MIDHCQRHTFFNQYCEDCIRARRRRLEDDEEHLAAARRLNDIATASFVIDETTKIAETFNAPTIDSTPTPDPTPDFGGFQGGDSGGAGAGGDF